MNAIINFQTCPLHISEMQHKADEAYQYIETLFKRSQKRLWRKVRKACDQYYTPNEQGFSAYDMNMAMMNGYRG